MSAEREIKEPSPRWFALWAVVPIAGLGYAWWHRHEVSAEALFCFVGMAALLLGMAVYGALRNY